MIARQYSAPEEDVDALGRAWVALSGGDEPAAEQLRLRRDLPHPRLHRLLGLEQEAAADVERLGAAWEQRST